MAEATVTIVVNDESLDVTGVADEGHPMVWRYKDGSGDPGEPPSFCTSQVVLVRDAAPFCKLMSDYLLALDDASNVPQERVKQMHDELMQMFTCVDLTNVVENVFTFDAVDAQAMEQLGL